MTTLIFLIIVGLTIYFIKKAIAANQAKENEEFARARERTLSNLEKNSELISERFYAACKEKNLKRKDVYEALELVTEKWRIYDMLEKQGLQLDKEKDNEIVKTLFIKGYNNYQYSQAIKLLIEQKIFNLDSERNKEKAKLILKNNDINIEDVNFTELNNKLVKEFDRQNEIKNQEQKRKDYEKKRALRQKEEEKRDALLKYKRFIGREKTIQMCKDKATEYRNQEAELRKSIEDLNKSANNLYNMSKERESSWGLHGGVASAIAGPAAGVVAASEIQRNNAAKRERNDQLASSIAQLHYMGDKNLREQIRNVAAHAKTWEIRAEEAPNLLVKEFPAEELMKKLNPQIQTLKILETGSVEMSVKVLQEATTDKLMIYDTVEAVIDGTFKAVIYHKDEKLGVAYFTFPYNGANKYTGLEGICCTSSENTYTSNELRIHFEPHQLWAIEKLKI